MVHKKLTLPEKICAACGRPFAWRKKWARDWPQVRYCSDRCRGSNSTSGPGPANGAGSGGKAGRGK
ncbi:hypothetical protein GCM10011497_29230 [Elstera cyanobacteriorum]|uniref:DUF2256 domain-containing protein n=1 Tax=Elstera cyanobacteriorum TaxID=2022747 RepID=A0A255XWX4_9PROT|nr:DUF2256 domain-containing protein [Elstera cyanobacteriorum]OYQ21412.1 DUF2256 domain-containing protein [Elstera cyanobacteriorum]GFZ96875.1 hypothetical protein GCM10011497_29230 [Elstera cyanobacteriorum]